MRAQRRGDVVHRLVARDAVGAGARSTIDPAACQTLRCRYAGLERDDRLRTVGVRAVSGLRKPAVL